MTFHSLIWPLGCLSGAIAVLAGAYGSHGLPKRISEILGETGEPTSTAITVDRHVRSWQTAAHYQVLSFFNFQNETTQKAFMNGDS